MIQRKGLDLLFDALSKMRKDFFLVIIGQGDEKEPLVQRAKKLGILDRIEFKGYIEGEELRQLYHESDLFVLPTREDCFALVILEAMCAALPVVVSKYADAVDDLIIDGVNGIIIDPYDAKSFADTLDGIIGDTKLKFNMGQRAQEMSLNFSFNRVSEGFIAAIMYALK